ncbi:transposase [Tateyamaria omphalii]|uniref:REP-associated tyrosine transposase n=1 Tax=Tateyamaria omphalii TaxID=299262 RepID=UPI001C9911D0|nr:transposase [Tateyamaria omphalii]MBY5932184.1 transposase [Tateyamaria omphalii]
MPRYIRSDSPDLTYFFTVRAARRGTDLFLREIDLLRVAMRKTKDHHPFEISEIVVLGDVIHTLWRLPPGDAGFSIRWRMLKSLFSRSVDAPQDVGEQRLRPGEKGLWQRRFWEHAIRDAEDLAAHRQMIWTAPVQAGWVNRPEEWPHSSIHRAIARGQFAPGGSVGPAYLPLDRRTPRAPYGVNAAAS